MSTFLYRYLSFESFVDMVQRQELAFVLPSLWEDVAEMLLYDKWLEKIDSYVERALFYAIRSKIYAQSWTKLKESDAMWRIYGPNNLTVKIKIRKLSVALLDNVRCLDVKYVKSLDKVDLPEKGLESFLQSLSIKRLPFQHEKEVRLVHYYQFKDTDDATIHAKSIFALGNHEVFKEMFPETDQRPMEEKIEELISITNLNNRKSVKYISFSHIKDFIVSATLHPKAPDWFEETLNDFCKRNGVNFEGKSHLYDSDKSTFSY